MVSDYSIDIDFKLKPSFPQQLKINQYDRGVYLKINLFDNGEPYTIPSTESLILELALPKGVGYIVSGSSIKDVSGNSFRVAIDRNISLNSGEASFNVSIVDKATGTTTRKGSFKNYIKILGNSIDESTVSGDLAVSIIETLQSTVATATATEANLEEAIGNGDLANYVQKVSGKDLSSNDFTDAYKTILDGLTTTINDAVLEGKKSLYPVNSIYLSLNSTNPSEVLGFGTWVQVAQGRSLVGVDTEDEDFEYASKTGGSKDVTLGLEHLPQNVFIDAETTDGTPNRYTTESGITWSNRINWVRNSSTQEAVSVVQPYYCVYIFKRTA